MNKTTLEVCVKQNLMSHPSFYLSYDPILYAASTIERGCLLDQLLIAERILVPLFELICQDMPTTSESTSNGL